MCHSEFVALNFKGTVKYTENLDVVLLRDQVRDAIVAVEQYANVALRGLVAITDLREFSKQLCALVDALDSFCSGARIVGCNIVVNVLQPALGFKSPRYCCHVRMRRCISSFEMVRLASASARPRSTIA